METGRLGLLFFFCFFHDAGPRAVIVKVRFCVNCKRYTGLQHKLRPVTLNVHLILLTNATIEFVLFKQ